MVKPAPEPHNPSPAKRAAAKRWASLMQRAFGIDVLACSRCAGRLTLLAVVLQPTVIRRILTHLRLLTEPPRITPARAPPTLTDPRIDEADFVDDIYDEPA